MNRDTVQMIKCGAQMVNNVTRRLGLRNTGVMTEVKYEIEVICAACDSGDLADKGEDFKDVYETGGFKEDVQHALVSLSSDNKELLEEMDSLKIGAVSMSPLQEFDIPTHSPTPAPVNGGIKVSSEITRLTFIMVLVLVGLVVIGAMFQPLLKQCRVDVSENVERVPLVKRNSKNMIELNWKSR